MEHKDSQGNHGFVTDGGVQVGARCRPLAVHGPPPAPRPAWAYTPAASARAATTHALTKPLPPPTHPSTRPQYMTAGRGIIHSEMPVVTQGGNLHGFQLWVNLPGKLKMCKVRWQQPQ